MKWIGLMFLCSCLVVTTEGDPTNQPSIGNERWCYLENGQSFKQCATFDNGSEVDKEKALVEMTCGCHVRCVGPIPPRLCFPPDAGVHE